MKSKFSLADSSMFRFSLIIFFIYSFQEDDDEDVDESGGVRLSIMQRLNALQEVLLKVQNVLDWAACLLERIHK